MKESTIDLIRAVKADLARTQAELAPVLANHPNPAFQVPEAQFIQAAQNTLRTCMEATLQAAGDYSDRTCIELAIRLASYAISALPLECQDEALDAVVRSLPAAHSLRLANGIIIQTVWETHGVRHPNVPGGRA